MAGGKCARARKERYGAQTPKPGGKARKVRLWDEKAKEDPETAKEPVETDDVKR